MNILRSISGVVLLLAITATNGFSQSSVLRSGTWLKMAIEKEGVYKINYDHLRKNGIDPGKIDPRKIKIYGNEGGMLPQANQANRPTDLQENAIFIAGEDDGKFDGNDFILFYAQGPDKAVLIPEKQIHLYENNLYSEENYYFLTVAEDNGKRVSTSIDLGTGFPAVNSFDDFIYHEKDEHNVLKSGREWFGERFNINNTYTFSFDIRGITPGTTVGLVSDVMSQSTSATSFKITLNGYQAIEQKVPGIPSGPYDYKGIHKRDTVWVSDASLGNAPANLEIRYDFIKPQNTALAFLDFFLLGFERELSLYNDQTIFSSKRSLENAVSVFEISNVSEDVSIWDITDAYNVKHQDFTISDKTASFATDTDQLKKFIVFNSKIPAPVFKGKVVNQDLRSTPTPNLLIVTHPDFESEALRLANHRHAFSNQDVAVVTPEQIYNEFSSGRQDVTAVRDFVRHLWKNNPDKLKSLLLFGKGSYDYKNRLTNNSNFVITYESRNSLYPLQTYSSDDYFAFLEDNEGNWVENLSGNHTLDIGVGRLPVRTLAEAQNIVDKIIDYDNNSKNLGSWRNQIVFVADDGNTVDRFTSLHQYQADQLAEYIENIPAANTKKLFMGTYPKVVRPNGESTPKLSNDLVRAFEKGSLIINYTGHGSERQWADENFFNDQTIRNLKNDFYPFLVTATCEFGRHDDPHTISSAEKSITAPNAGVIGMVTTARPVNATTNFELNEAFYEALFQRDGNAFFSIGEVFRRTKNNSTSGVANRNFSLLGDPSMTLALPPHQAVVTSIHTKSGSDTLKALSTVVITGEITTFTGEKLSDFNGIIEATLFDKKTSTTTIGRNDPFTFNQWNSALFRGKATVTNGVFQFEFILPKNIAYQVGEGKLSLYAADSESLNDASGFFTQFKVGGSEVDVEPDNTSPEIRLYIGDTTFVDGGVASSDTHLLARLTDNSGINISSYGFGNNIIAVLDDDAETFVLNDFYVADTDDPRSGWINYPIKGLAPGKHRLTLKAWDVYNNYAIASIGFVVTDDESLVIESFGNTPNPFSENTSLFFTHNRSGDDLQAQVFIQKITGEVIKTGEIIIPASGYKVNLLELSSAGEDGKKLSAGLYLARLVVRSLTNGSKNEQVTKLIVLN